MRFVARPGVVSLDYVARAVCPREGGHRDGFNCGGCYGTLRVGQRP